MSGGGKPPGTAEEFRELAAAARRVANGLCDEKTHDRLRQLADEYDKKAAASTAGNAGEKDA